MEQIGWGIAGPGRMAAAFVADFAHVEGARVVAVGSRSLERARAFADEHDIEGAHGSYAELCADPAVDVVYVATPHPQHRAVALAAIEAGKAVLVEKAFTATLAGTTEVVDAARERGVFCMEGMWTRFQPVIRRLHEIIDAGELGRVTAVQGDLFAFREFVAGDRLFDPELGGGAMLDLGVYALHFAVDVLGAPASIDVRGSLFPNGVDAQASMLLGYPDGRQASLAVSLQAPGPGRMVVMGTGGWAEVEPRFHHPTTLSVHRSGQAVERLELPPVGKGYGHEVDHVNECLRAGLLESPVVPLADTVTVMSLAEQALLALGVHHHDR